MIIGGVHQLEICHAVLMCGFADSYGLVTAAAINHYAQALSFANFAATEYSKCLPVKHLLRRGVADINKLLGKYGQTSLPMPKILSSVLLLLVGC